MKQFSREKIIADLKHTLDKYEGMLINDIFSDVENDIQECIDNYLKDHYVHISDFPIEFCNSNGRFTLQANGDCIIIPKLYIEKMNINVKIIKNP
jgi:hypothetical protein